MKLKINDDLQFLHDWLLICPETREKQKILDVTPNKNITEIITKGKSRKWKHTIISQEI